MSLVDVFKLGLCEFFRQRHCKDVRVVSYGSAPKGTFVFPHSDFDYGLLNMPASELWKISHTCEKSEGFQYEDCKFIYKSRVTSPKCVVLTFVVQYTKNGHMVECSVDAVAHCSGSDACFRNSVYIRSHTLIPAVSNVLVSIKQRAAAKNLNCAPKNTLSSYGWELFIIAALINLKKVARRIPHFGLPDGFVEALFSTTDSCKLYSEAACKNVCFDTLENERCLGGQIDEIEVIQEILTLMLSKKPVFVGKFGQTCELPKKSTLVLVDPVCNSSGKPQNVAASVDESGYKRIVAGLREMVAPVSQTYGRTTNPEIEQL